MLAFWPFDFSCSGFFFILLILLWWLAWSVKEMAKDAAKAAKKALDNETVQEVGKGFLAAWLDSYFGRK